MELVAGSLVDHRQTQKRTGEETSVGRGPTECGRIKSLLHVYIEIVKNS